MVGSLKVTVTYDLLGNLLVRGEGAPQVLRQKYLYDDSGRKSESETREAGEDAWQCHYSTESSEEQTLTETCSYARTVLSTLTKTYAYDSQGRLVRLDRTLSWGNFGGRTQFEYDQAGCLVLVRFTSSRGSSRRQERQCDGRGNSVHEWEYIDDGEPVEIDPISGLPIDPVVSSTTKCSYTYDSVGNWIERTCEKNVPGRAAERQVVKRVISYHGR